MTKRVFTSIAVGATVVGVGCATLPHMVVKSSPAAVLECAGKQATALGYRVTQDTTVETRIGQDLPAGMDGRLASALTAQKTRTADVGGTDPDSIAPRDILAVTLSYRGRGYPPPTVEVFVKPETMSSGSAGPDSVAAPSPATRADADTLVAKCWQALNG